MGSGGSQGLEMFDSETMGGSSSRLTGMTTAVGLMRGTVAAVPTGQEAGRETTAPLTMKRARLPRRDEGKAKGIRVAQEQQYAAAPACLWVLCWLDKAQR